MNFKKARKAAGVKAVDAAAELGISVQAIHAYERGEYEPNIAALQKMARLYGCTIEELLADGAEECVEAQI